MTAAFRTCRFEAEAAEAGFSLVDTLVALALLAVMSGLMASFVGQFRTIGRLQQDAEAQGELEAVIIYLQGTIAAAMPLPLLRSPPEQRFSLEGGPDSIEFVATARQGVSSFGLRETAIALEGKGDVRTLVQTFRPRRLDARAAALLSVELARGVGAIAFRYLGYEGASRKPVWSEEWKARPGLPAAIRIELTARRNGETVLVSGVALLKLSNGSMMEPSARASP